MIAFPIIALKLTVVSLRFSTSLLTGICQCPALLFLSPRLMNIFWWPSESFHVFFHISPLSSPSVFHKVAFQGFAQPILVPNELLTWDRFFVLRFLDFFQAVVSILEWSLLLQGPPVIATTPGCCWLAQLPSLQSFHTHLLLTQPCVVPGMLDL